ncbi:hypothetical protein BDV97DRAFT_77082 [Delphinella strobiligena]|nr:hypothetical protein BDV97DRAFT_77082 [Delphinella strobiligena]
MTDQKSPPSLRFHTRESCRPEKLAWMEKWLVTGSLLFVDVIVSFGASGFSPASTKFAKDFGVSSGIYMSDDVSFIDHRYR